MHPCENVHIWVPGSGRSHVCRAAATKHIHMAKSELYSLLLNGKSTSGFRCKTFFSFGLEVIFGQKTVGAAP